MQEGDFLQVESLKRVFRTGATNLVLFKNLTLRVGRGQMVAIVGESGAGKSSLLHILGALDRPSEGEVFCGQIKFSALADEQAADFRNRMIGFVWQFHYLLPEFTATENVAMPLMVRGMARRNAEEQARQWLAEVGLQERAHHRPGELSGGEQQRVAIARALITRPQLLLADEPTGDLDHRTAETVFALIARLHREHGLTSIVATHNLDFARRCDRILRLQGGQLQQI